MDAREKLRHEIDKITGFITPSKQPYFGKLTLIYVSRAHKRATESGAPDDAYLFPAKDTESNYNINYARSGHIMEINNEMLKKINEEVQESRKIMQTLSNDLVSLSNVIEPQLLDVVKKIRTNRMTVTTELQKSLKIMREVRQFFLEDDYKKEIERLEKFVNLGERMRILIEDGTMDAVCDVVIKLAIGEEDEVERPIIKKSS